MQVQLVPQVPAVPFRILYCAAVRHVTHSFIDGPKHVAHLVWHAIQYPHASLDVPVSQVFTQAVLARLTPCTAFKQ